MQSIAAAVTAALRKAETSLLSAIFGRPFPPPVLCVDTYESPITNGNRSPFSIKDVIGDGFLWAVPKTRRTIEKRLNRKYGVPGYYYKPLRVKTNLRVCNTCGHDHEVGLLCPNCYNKIMEETKEMQEKIRSELGLNPIEQEVIVLYEGEALEEPEEFWKGKRVVEMKKPRPAWFSKNLLQKTTQKPATSTDIKPTELA
ncbi:mitochondrial ribosomal protein L32 [Arctopsyche grandis]|uniref:mitochondrial ribosomal protein L32 n=1 Tax=Arctopsyche grandis TaxID=121162 RepID=UPI00406D88F5